MKTIKKLGMKSVSSTNLSTLRKGSNGNPGLIVHYNNHDTIKSIRSVSASVQQGRKNSSSSTRSRKTTTTKTGARRTSSNSKSYHTHSLPRPSLREKRHKVKEFSYQVDLDPLIKAKRAKSLEHMLMGVGGGSSSSDRSSSTTFSSENSSHHAVGPHVWVEERSSRKANSKEMTKPEIPSYCTIDRNRLKKRQHQAHKSYNSDNRTVSSDFSGSLTMPRQPKKPQRMEKPARKNLPLTLRSKSVEILDQDHLDHHQNVRSTGYIGDCGIDELKRVSSEYILDKKSVTIHPRVTEFHYMGEPDEEGDLKDKFEETTSFSESSAIPIPIPEPIFPTMDLTGSNIPVEDSETSNNNKKSSLLAKLSLKPKPSYTKDQIIDFYCQSGGDVQL